MTILSLTVRKSTKHVICDVAGTHQPFRCYLDTDTGWETARKAVRVAREAGTPITLDVQHVCEQSEMLRDLVGLLNESPGEAGPPRTNAGDAPTPGREATPSPGPGGPALPDPPSGARVVTRADADDWRGARRSLGIGSSEAASVLGLGFHTPLQLFAKKTGAAPKSDESMPEWVMAGKLFELPAATWFASRTQRLVVPDQRLLQSADTECMVATCDFLQRDDCAGRDWGILEVKNVGSYKRNEWADTAPVSYQIQLQHQLYVTGYQWGTLCAVIGGNKLVWYDFERDEKFLQFLAKECKAFWAAVQANDVSMVDAEPEMDGLKMLYPEDDGSIVQLPDDLAELDEAWVRSREEVAMAEERARKKKKKHEALTAQLCAKIGRARYGELGGVRYEWETVNRKGYTVAPKRYRTLRRHSE